MLELQVSSDFLYSFLSFFIPSYHLFMYDVVSQLNSSSSLSRSHVFNGFSAISTFLPSNRLWAHTSISNTSNDYSHYRDMATKPVNNSLRVVPLWDPSSFPEWSRTVRLALHKYGQIKYITNDYTAIVQAINDYDAEHTATLFESLDIISNPISISSGSTSGEKSAAALIKTEDLKKKQIAALVLANDTLKAARDICKGRRKTFVFICSTVAPKLLEDIMGMSDGCPFTLWTAINNRYGINDVALQTARCDLGKLDVYLV